MSVICKSFLSAIMLMEIVFCSVSDVRKGIIPNHAIILGLIGALAGEIAYFTFNGSGRLGMFYIVCGYGRVEMRNFISCCHCSYRPNTCRKMQLFPLHGSLFSYFRLLLFI